MSTPRISKALQRRIDYALRNAERAQRYLNQADVAVGRLNGHASTTLHYTRGDGSTFYAIDKQIGSDLCGLQFCIDELSSILDQVQS